MTWYGHVSCSLPYASLPLFLSPQDDIPVGTVVSGGDAVENDDGDETKEERKLAVMMLNRKEKETL